MQHIQLRSSSCLALPKGVLPLSSLYPVMDFVVGVVLDNISVFYLWFIYVVFLLIQWGCFSSTWYLLWQSNASPIWVGKLLFLYNISHNGRQFDFHLWKEHKDVFLFIYDIPRSE